MTKKTSAEAAARESMVEMAERMKFYTAEAADSHEHRARHRVETMGVRDGVTEKGDPRCFVWWECTHCQKEKKDGGDDDPLQVH